MAVVAATDEEQEAARILSFPADNPFLILALDTMACTVEDAKKSHAELMKRLRTPAAVRSIVVQKARGRLDAALAMIGTAALLAAVRKKHLEFLAVEAEVRRGEKRKLERIVLHTLALESQLSQLQHCGLLRPEHTAGLPLRQ